MPELPTRVVMVDLMSIVPYYSGHLCAALQTAGDDFEVLLAAVEYRHDPECFRRLGIRNHPMVIDAANRVRRVPQATRQAIRAVEYLLNLTGLVVRCAFVRRDIVHVQFLPLLGCGVSIELLFVRLLRTLGCRIVYTVHNVLPQDSGERLKPSYRRMYALADRLICHDVESAQRLTSEFGTPEGRIDIIPHGPLFDSTQRSSMTSARQRLGLGADECLVLWQGIIRPYKGLSFLLQVWRRVCEMNSHATLVIAGTGSPDLLDALRHEISAMGIASRLRLELRFLPVSELMDFYDAADILVYPYSEITTSGALATGISSGKAIVASSLPAFHGVLQDGQTAFLEPYGDVERWAKSLLRLICDTSLRCRFGEALLDSVRHEAPGWNDIARRTRDCYRAALAKSDALQTRILTS